MTRNYDDLKAEVERAPNPESYVQCAEREGGGVRCELVAGHAGGHYIVFRMGDDPEAERQLYRPSVDLPHLVRELFDALTVSQNNLSGVGVSLAHAEEQWAYWEKNAHEALALAEENYKLYERSKELWK